MIETYRSYVLALDELFVIVKEMQTCTDYDDIQCLVGMKNELIKELRKLRSILNQKESELFVNGEN
jgi:hypothetical protein